MTEVKEKIALITGGANGIGFETAKKLLSNRAAHVSILDLLNSNGEEAAAKLNDEFGKGRAIFIVCDVTKAQELEDGFAQTVEKLGGLDIVINNAGIMDDSRWELMIQINCTAVIRGILLGYKYMSKNNGGEGGTIVNISSVVGVTPSEYYPIYSSLKHAIVGLGRSFGQPYHYEKTGVRILTVCPQATRTELLDNVTKNMLDMVESSDIIEFLGDVPIQSPESVAENIVEVITIGTNGSVWFSTANKPVCELELPTMADLRLS